MNWFSSFFRGLWYTAWYLFAAAVVLIAAVFAAARLLFPLIGDYNRDVEKLAQEFVGQPLKIMSIDAEWHGFSPSLVLNNVRLMSRDGKETLLHFSRARLDVDLVDTARSLKVNFRRFALSGANLSVVRTKDGMISLAGFEQNTIAESDDTSGISRWLLSQGEISIHAKNLLFQDLKANKKRYHFSNVSLVLRNDGDRHLVDGAISLPRNEQREFIFASEIAGNFMESTDWSGTIYVSATNINVNDIFGDILIKGHKISLGESNFEIWTEWDKATVTNIQGDFSLHRIRLVSSSSSQPFLVAAGNNANTTNESAASSSAVVRKKDQSIVAEYDQAIGRFVWDKYLQGWQLNGDRLVIARDKQLWKPSRFSLHYIKQEEEGDNFSMQVSFLRLQDLLPLIPSLVGFDWKYAQQLESINPSGDFRNVNFRWNSRNQDISLAASLVDVTYSQYQKIPGFENLSGDIWLKRNSGMFAFNTEKGAYKDLTMFRSAIPVDRLQGDVYWNIGEEEAAIESRNLRISSNGLNAKAVLSLEIPRADESPFLSLITNFEGGDIRHASTYYPVSIMPETAVRWLDTALVEGEVMSGGVLVYGATRKFPFSGINAGTGVFDVRVKVNNGLLDYAEDWPQIHELKADVQFRGNKMTVVSDAGKLLNSDLKGVGVVIPDLSAKKMIVDINGVISGETRDKLNYITSSPPLNETLGEPLQDVKADGMSNLDLSLQLTIGKTIDSVLHGKLELIDNKLSYGPVTDIVTNANGVLHIYNDGAEAKSISGNLFGQPNKFSIKRVRSGKSGKAHTVKVVARGKYNSAGVINDHFPWLKDLARGNSRWTVALDLPMAADKTAKSKDPKRVGVSLYSSMRGVEISLPPPFRKDKDDVRKLNYFVDFLKQGKALMRVSYAGQVDGLFMVDLKDGPSLEKGEIRFGGGPVVLPRNKGLRVVGNVKELSLDIWDNLFSQFTAIAMSKNANASEQVKNNRYLPEFLQSVQLSVGKAVVLAQEARNLRLDLESKGDWYLIKLDSKAWKGEVKVPAVISRDPISLDMQYINLTSAESSGGKSDPTKIPPFKLNSRQVNYRDKKFGHVAIEVSKTKNGILAEQIIIKPRATTIIGHGSWLLENGEQKSSYEFVLNSSDLGKTMIDLGYVNTILHGQGDMKGNVSWVGSLGNIDFEKFDGDVHFNFKNGRILDIEPGSAARVFGLFSLQTLPRRLALDFSDLFAKGIGFDKVKGDFNIESGNAYTDNLALEGPSANVLIRGRIGLQDQDYDQKIVVTPHITDMAVLLSIITSQPVLFFLQQLMKNDIDSATSLEYSLTGSWDNFALEPILKNNTETFPDEPDV